MATSRTLRPYHERHHPLLPEEPFLLLGTGLHMEVIDDVNEGHASGQGSPDFVVANA